MAPDEEPLSPSPAPDAPSPETAEAFAAVYAACFPPIVRYVRRRLGDAAAEDAAAEVFLRAFRQRGTRDAPDGIPLPWLYGIAANVISEERRAERRRLRTMEKLAGERTVDDPDPGARLGTDPRLIRALRDLTPIDRETLLLVAWGELTREEVALALGVPAGTVRSRLARARRQLDRALAASGTPDDLRPLTGDHHG